MTGRAWIQEPASGSAVSVNDGRIDVVLVHEPVVNRRGETIGSAVTNLDLHDIARACRTYGVAGYWVITPYEKQQKLARQIIGHWLEGHGRDANPDRGTALSFIRIRGSLREALDDISRESESMPLRIATCAADKENTVGYRKLREQLMDGRSIVLVFGTAWGLAPEVFAMMDATLPPIRGRGSYNHLSVRSAVSIILDRLVGEWE